MGRSRRVSLEIATSDLMQVRRAVEAGEFASTAAVMREALRSWLERRSLHGGHLGVSRFSGSLEALAEPCERVELLFDAGDAKA
jgi:Arc/MetJ-type ribon-helix-helix transcriptional regulator